jgi:hypothetical protein
MTYAFGFRRDATCAAPQQNKMIEAKIKTVAAISRLRLNIHGTSPNPSAAAMHIATMPIHPSIRACANRVSYRTVPMLFLLFLFD